MHGKLSVTLLPPLNPPQRPRGRPPASACRSFRGPGYIASHSPVRSSVHSSTVSIYQKRSIACAAGSSAMERSPERELQQSTTQLDEARGLGIYRADEEICAAKRSPNRQRSGEYQSSQGRRVLPELTCSACDLFCSAIRRFLQ